MGILLFIVIIISIFILMIGIKKIKDKLYRISKFIDIEKINKENKNNLCLITCEDFKKLKLHKILIKYKSIFLINNI